MIFSTSGKNICLSLVALPVTCCTPDPNTARPTEDHNGDEATFVESLCLSSGFLLVLLNDFNLCLGLKVDVVDL